MIMCLATIKILNFYKESGHVFQSLSELSGGDNMSSIIYPLIGYFFISLGYFIVVLQL